MWEVLEHLPLYLKIGILLAISLSFLGFWLDKYVRNHFQQQIADAWQRIDNDLWPNKFLTLYDHLLTSSSSSIGRPQIMRSALLSLLSMIVIMVAWFPLELTESTSRSWWPKDTMVGLLIIATYVIPVNILGDYLSFWETRIVVGFMAKTKRSLLRILFVVLDLAATTLLFLIFTLLGTVVFVAVLYVAGMELPEHILVHVISAFGEIVLGGGWLFADVYVSDLNVFGVLYFTTMATSIWVWTYMIGSLLWPVVVFIPKVIAVERRPTGFAMTIGGVVLGLLVAAIGGLIDCVLPLIEWTLKEDATPS